MQVKLGELADIQMGYSFRSRLEASTKGGISIIQMKDLLEENRVDCNDLVKIDMNTIKDHHLVMKGDLVFRSRGLVTTSAILLDNPGRVIVAAPLLRIRIVKQNMVLPEYLNWFINQRQSQIYFTRRAEGTALKKIGKKELEDLNVFLPPIEEQAAITEIADLSAREQILLNNLANNRARYTGALLMKYAKDNQRGSK